MNSISSILLPEGFRHEALGEVQSTNLECLEKARVGDGGNLWITAERQSLGKGSRGRGWVSEEGNLYASLLLREPGPVGNLHTLTFAASLAIRDCLLALNGAGLLRVTLKWPNDVLVNGGKIAGILLESHVLGGSRYVIIGIGINVAHHPEKTLHPATSLQNEGIDVSLEELLQHLARAMATRLDQWNGGQGMAQTRSDWLAAARGIGEMIEIRMPASGGEKVLTGRFEGIDENGLLILGGAGGKREHISVADIFFA